MRRLLSLALLAIALGGCNVAECRRLRSEIKKEMADAPGTCAASTDCACYPGGVSESGCGGISRRETAESIAKLTARFRAQKCSGEVSCSAWMCSPACVNGKCANASVGASAP